MITSAFIFSCGNSPDKKSDAFDYNVEQFADISVLRYRVDGFEFLSPKQKEMIYYLNEAALQGRDILYDQNGEWNLAIRRTLEAIYQHYKGDRTSSDFIAMEQYLKRVWFSNGIHHHYSADKFIPGFSQEFFKEAVLKTDPKKLPLRYQESVETLISELTPVIFDPAVDSKRINQAANEDLILTSACNYYQGVTQSEAEDFYNKMKNPNDSTPISYGLNSRLVKKDGVIKEMVWKADGLYGKSIEKIIYWLEKAKSVAENDLQKRYISKLIEFYNTGDLKAFDQYSVLWVEDKNSEVDFVNGFIESYGDPLGLKASWESMVNFKDKEASKRTEIISNNAQWFEDNSPVDPKFKKDVVKGVSAKVINVAIIGGDCYPATPIGVNLPNANWIRRDHGSKSVTVENITRAYDKASIGNGFAEEFVWSDEERALLKDYGFMAGNIHTDLHECLGHGSGKLLDGTDSDALKAYGSPLEETRADLFALYYIADPKMVELGLMPNSDAYKAEYYTYMLNGLMTQLIRIEPGMNIEQAHMRNRYLISNWILEKGSKDGVVELRKRDGKTFVVINDYDKMRSLVAELLSEVQRIKSEGDFVAAQNLVETYAIKVNQDIHKEILLRNQSLKVPPYRGFINPVYTPVYDEEGNMVDVTVTYNEKYADQHLRYSKDYSVLPTYN